MQIFNWNNSVLIDEYTGLRYMCRKAIRRVIPFFDIIKAIKPARLCYNYDSFSTRFVSCLV